MEQAVSIVVGLLIVLGSVAYALLRRRQERKDEAALHLSVAREMHIPASLHPVIDPNVCIGSLSCVKACPEGDILGIVDGAAKMITGANCIGHGRCYVECPVDAIKLVFGTSERGVDLPEIDDRFESSRPGVHIVGELGGMGLIRNAMTQGILVGQHLSGMLGASDPPIGNGRPSVDVAVVGAGPAGLATALSCQHRGLTVQVFEQDSLGGTVAHYPRQKLIMTDSVDLPVFGRWGRRGRMSKDELLQSFQEIIAKGRLSVATGVRVNQVGGQDGAFTIRTDKVEFVARKVVLATGRRGSPRKLDVPGEELSKVTYGLIDPEQYEGSRVLIVGGGDAALEAAAALVEMGKVQVSIAYRGPTFVRSRQANQERVHQLIAAGRIDGYFNTTVTQIRAKEVVLETPQGTRLLSNDYVIAAIGGQLPLEFLTNLQVGVKRHFGESTAASVHGVQKTKSDDHRLRSTEDEERQRKIFARILLVIGAAIVAGLAWTGRDYYLLSTIERARSPLHATLRSSGPWGHGVGLVATLFMMSNFIYAVRKRLRILKGTAPIRTWLTFHMFVGFMSPLVIAFHATFQSKNLLASATALALMIVVGTGVIGRFIYGMVPSAQGKIIELADLRERWDRVRNSLRVDGGTTLVGVLAHGALDEPERDDRIIGHILRMPIESLRWRLALLRARKTLDATKRDLVSTLNEARLLRTQIGFYRIFRRLLGWWRFFHVTLAVFLVLAIAIHVGVSVYLGYGSLLPW